MGAERARTMVLFLSLVPLSKVVLSLVESIKVVFYTSGLPHEWKGIIASSATIKEESYISFSTSAHALRI